jgi:hypothetical protein
MKYKPIFRKLLLSYPEEHEIVSKIVIEKGDIC